MKFDDKFCCSACGTMFRPIRGEDICPKCMKEENERLAAMAHELEDEHADH